MKKLLVLLVALVFGLVMSAPAFAFKDWVGTKPPSKARIKQVPKTKQAPKDKKAPKTKGSTRGLLEQGSR